jgi:hypothetical protein
MTTLRNEPTSKPSTPELATTRAVTVEDGRRAHEP